MGDGWGRHGEATCMVIMRRRVNKCKRYVDRGQWPRGFWRGRPSSTERQAAWASWLRTVRSKPQLKHVRQPCRSRRSPRFERLCSINNVSSQAPHLVVQPLDRRQHHAAIAQRSNQTAGWTYSKARYFQSPSGMPLNRTLHT